MIGTEKVRTSIGLLQEKSLHSILKYYYEPNDDYHEVQIGQYVADICNEERIIEIQNAHFDKLRGKLSAFLALNKVTIVYPIAVETKLHWIDPETGELSEIKKSPKKRNAYHIFKELYYIKEFLADDNLTICMPLLKVSEYKLLNGYGANRKKRAQKYDKIPEELLEEVNLCCIEDYIQFLPIELTDDFTIQDFAICAKINKELASFCVNILMDLGIVSRIGKKGRAYLYQINEMP